MPANIYPVCFCCYTLANYPVHTSVASAHKKWEWVWEFCTNNYMAHILKTRP